MANLPPLPPGFAVDNAVTAAAPVAPPPGFLVDGAASPGTPQYAAQFVARQAAGQAQPQPATPPPEWQPQDVIPAPLRAFSNHAVESVPILGAIAHNVTASPMNDAIAQSADSQAPVAALAGDVFGTVAPLAAAGGFIPGAARVLGMEGSLPTRALMSAASAGTMGGADALIGGASPQDAGFQAAADAAMGGALPLVGATAGRLLGMGAPRAVPLADLQAAKNAAYSAVDNLGVHYSAQGVDKLVNDMATKAAADNISQMRHPQAWSMLQDLQNRPAGATASLTQLDQMRQVIRRDLVDPAATNPASAAEAHFGRQMIGSIDDFIDGAKPSDIVSGSGPQAAQAIADARAANSTFRKSEMVAEALSKADLGAASTGSGGNIDNAIRQNLRSILNSPAKSRGLTPVESAMMERIVRGGPVNNALRTMGRLSPVGNGLMGMLGIGATQFIPGGVAIPVGGTIAKVLADRSTQRGAAVLQALIANGGKRVPQSPVAGALLSRMGGAAAVPLIENQMAGQSPDPVAQAMMAAAGQ